jgi:hypothetical protein
MIVGATVAHVVVFVVQAALAPLRVAVYRCLAPRPS